MFCFSAKQTRTGLIVSAELLQWIIMFPADIIFQVVHRINQFVLYEPWCSFVIVKVSLTERCYTLQTRLYALMLVFRADITQIWLKFLFGVEISSAVDAPCNGQQPFGMLHYFQSGLLSNPSLQRGIDRAVHSPSIPQYKTLQKLCPHEVVTGSLSTLQTNMHWSSSPESDERRKSWLLEKQGHHEALCRSDQKVRNYFIKQKKVEWALRCDLKLYFQGSEH